MVVPEFFLSRLNFTVGATAVVLVAGAFTLYLGRLMDGILVSKQDRTDRQVLGALFLFKNIIFPAAVVGIYVNQKTLPVFSPGSLGSLIGLIAVGGFYSAQNKLHKLHRFSLHKTDRFEEKFVTKKDQVLPERFEDTFIDSVGMNPLEFLQEDIELAIKFLLSKTMFFLTSFLFVFFLYRVMVTGSFSVSVLASVLAFSGLSLMAQSWAYYHSDDIWSHIETEAGEVYEGKLISAGENYVLWTEEEKIEVNSENISSIRQSKWKDEKLEVEEDG